MAALPVKLAAANLVSAIAVFPARAAQMTVFEVWAAMRDHNAFARPPGALFLNEKADARCRGVGFPNPLISKGK
jgi:hypothetical protein